MFKIISTKRQREEREAIRLALLVSIQALANGKVQLQGSHAQALARGFNLVKQEGDPNLGFDEKKQTPASRIIHAPATMLR